MDEWRVFFRNAREQAKFGVYGDANIAIENLKTFRNYVEDVKTNSDGVWDQTKCDVLIEKINEIIAEIAVYGLHSPKVRAFFVVIAAEIFACNEIPELPDTEPVAGKDILPTEPMPYVPKSNKPEPAGGVSAAQPSAPKPQGGSLWPQSLDEFIGQAQVVERLKETIKAAQKRGERYIGNTLLFGNRGLGKSTLMRLIAKELGVECHIIDAANVTQETFQLFLRNIANGPQPTVIGVDEIHALKGNSQTMLLTLLNDRVLRYVDKNGIPYEIPVEFTFIGATTDPDKILGTIKDRCSNLTFYLTDYTHDELKLIFASKFSAYGLKAADDVIESCIARCRSSIREVEAFVKGMSDKAINNDLSEIPLALAEEYFAQRGLDESGLSEKDREILNTLNTEENDGFLSAETLAARVRLSAGVYTSEYEPYLLKIGYIGKTSRGRYLTEQGKQFVLGKQGK